MNETKAVVNGNQLEVTRMVNAPRELVWKVWTEPEHVKHWWGPNGFTNTIEHMEVKTGGDWKFIMHGPDGVDYPNHVVYTQVIKHELLAYSHGGEVNGEEVGFSVEVRFTSEKDKTRITMKSIFSSPEVLQQLIKQVGALEGANQTLSRCDAYLAETLIKL